MIRALERNDHYQWLPLWNANCLDQVADDISDETWRRITNPKQNVFGLGFFDPNDQLRGFLHYILHPTTGYKEPACYMQDLFVDENFRRRGVARRLVWELNEIGKKEQWARIYWFAENDNEAVQNLYKNLGIRMDFSLHMLPTHGQ